MARIDMETVLFGRLHGLLVFVYQQGIDDETGEPFPTDKPIEPTGSNPLYSDPIAYGLGYAGVTMGNPYNPSSADIDSANPRLSTQTLELAELRLIRNTLGSFTDVTESEQDRSASYNQLAERFSKIADGIEDRYKVILNPTRGGGMIGGKIRDIPPTASRPYWRPGWGRYQGGGCIR